MVIAPFFVMPTVSALVWKNLLMHPVSGLFAWVASLFGVASIDWFNDVPLFAVILIVAWQWLPFGDPDPASRRCNRRTRSRRKPPKWTAPARFRRSFI